MVVQLVNGLAMENKTHKSRMAVDQVLNLYAVKHLGAILGVLARPVVRLGVWHLAFFRGMISSFAEYGRYQTDYRE